MRWFNSNGVGYALRLVASETLGDDKRGRSKYFDRDPALSCLTQIRSVPFSAPSAFPPCNVLIIDCLCIGSTVIDKFLKCRATIMVTAKRPTTECPVILWSTRCARFHVRNAQFLAVAQQRQRGTLRPYGGRFHKGCGSAK